MPFHYDAVSIQLLILSLVSPFGRIEPARKDLLDPHLGRKYWEWSESQVKPYM